ANVSANISNNSKNRSVFSAALDILDDEDEEGSLHEEAEPDTLLDADLVHPDLRSLYEGMPWVNKLLRARFIGYSVNEGVFDGFSPVSYGSLCDSMPPRVKSKLVRSTLFMEYKDFKSPVRVPLTNFGVHPAAFVTSGICVHSHVSQGKEIGNSVVKQLHIRPLENDWEILQCNIGTFYNDEQLHAPGGRGDAIIFQTKRKGWTPKGKQQQQQE
ncbi:hypothetical protein MPER_08011, partial [Moniliophthora perniciosa FA553]